MGWTILFTILFSAAAFAHGDHAEAPADNCSEQLAQHLAQLVKDDELQILPLQFRVTTLKLAKRIYPHKTLESSLKADQERLSQLNTQDPAVLKRLQELYQADKSSELSARIDKLKVKVPTLDYFRRSNRLSNDEVSAYLLTERLNPESDISEMDVAITWYMQKISDETARVSGASSAAHNLTQISTRLAHQLGGVGKRASDETIDQQLDKAEKQLADSLAQLAEQLKAKLPECFPEADAAFIRRVLGEFLTFNGLLNPATGCPGPVAVAPVIPEEKPTSPSLSDVASELAATEEDNDDDEATVPEKAEVNEAPLKRPASEEASSIPTLTSSPSVSGSSFARDEVGVIRSADRGICRNTPNGPANFSVSRCGPRPDQYVVRRIYEGTTFRDEGRDAPSNYTVPDADSFSFTTKNESFMVGDGYGVAQRGWELSAENRARQNAMLTVYDQSKLSTKTHQVYYRTFMIFPRTQMPEMIPDGDGYRMVLANGEEVRFDKNKNVIPGGVLTEGELAGPYKAPNVNYVGKGLSIVFEQTNPNVTPFATRVGQAKISYQGKTCSVNRTELIETRSYSSEGYPDETVFRFPTDQGFDQFLRKRCKFGFL